MKKKLYIMSFLLCIFSTLFSLMTCGLDLAVAILRFKANSYLVGILYIVMASCVFFAGYTTLKMVVTLGKIIRE